VKLLAASVAYTNSGFEKTHNDNMRGELVEGTA
jgi:hypothetical protein